MSVLDGEGFDARHPMMENSFEQRQTENKLIVEQVDVQGRKEVVYNIHVWTQVEGDALMAIVVELTLEDDIFYVVQGQLMRDGFAKFKLDNHLKKSEEFSFDRFLDFLLGSFHDVMSNRTTYGASCDDSSLALKQRVQFKEHVIFRLPLVRPDARYVRAQAEHRFRARQVELREARRTLTEFYKHIQRKDPEMGDQLARESKFVG